MLNLHDRADEARPTLILRDREPRHLGILPLPRRVPKHVVIAASGWGSRIVTAVAQLIVVRLLLDKLGVNGYAIFALLTGLQGWFLLSDLGVGVSVQNHVSEARSSDRSVASILFAGRLLAVALLVLTIGLLFVVAPRLSAFLLGSFEFIDGTQQVELFLLAGSLAIGLGIGSLVYKVWYAEHRGYLSNIVPGIATVCGLIGIWLAGHLDPSQRLRWSIVAFLGPTALLPMGIMAWQITHTLRQTALPSLDRATATAVMRRAVGFWIFAVMAAITLQIDYVVLSQFVGPADIAIYALSSKIYALVFFIYNALLMALWPVFSEMLARRDITNAHAFLRRYLKIGLIYMGVASFALVWLLPAAMHILAPSMPKPPSTWLILAMGGYYMLRVWSDTFATLLQSMSKLRALWLFVPLQALLSASLQWALAPRFGLLGVIAGLSASFLLTVVWGLPWACQRQFAEISRTS